jgi:hypothetical protein
MYTYNHKPHSDHGPSSLDAFLTRGNRSGVRARTHVDRKLLERRHVIDLPVLGQSFHAVNYDMRRGLHLAGRRVSASIHSSEYQVDRRVTFASIRRYTGLQFLATRR